jgi:hypothetical protein
LRVCCLGCLRLVVEVQRWAMRGRKGGGKGLGSWATWPAAALPMTISAADNSGYAELALPVPVRPDQTNVVQKEGMDKQE